MRNITKAREQQHSIGKCQRKLNQLKVEHSDTAPKLKVGINKKLKDMKTSLLKTLYVASTLLFLFSCKKDFNESEEVDERRLPDGKEMVVEAKIISTNPYKLESPFLIEKSAKIKDTNIQTYGYVLANTSDENLLQARVECWSIVSAWFYYGRCLVYGTMFTDCSGNQIFAPCGFNCFGFNDICPQDPDEWMAKGQDKPKSEKTVKLTFK